MKSLLILLAFLGTGAAAVAQNPVAWSFTTKKVNDKTYEVQMTAIIQGGWHLYAQQQPKDAIAQPTTFQFNKSPLVSLEGPVKELGKLEKFHDKELDVSANQYSSKVVFVQVVKLKGKARTAVTGKLEYQTCNDEKCLPPKTVPFTIALN
jgi:hypothetical protein